MAETKPRDQLRIRRRSGCLWPRSACALLVCAAVLSCSSPLSADSFEEHFSGPAPSWEVKSADPSVKTTTHRRSREHGTEDVGEYLVIEANRSQQKVQIEHSLPKSRVLNELEVGLWVRTNSPGLRIHLHVLLPEYEHPQTGRTLGFFIPGEAVEEVGAWQRITCRTDDKLVHDRLVQARAQWKLKLAPKRMIVDRVVLTWPLQPGANELSLDELTFGPLVRAEEDDVVLASDQPDSSEPAPVQFRLDRMEIEGKPTFLRIVPYHKEPLKDLAASGFNVVWIPDYSDRALLKSLRENGLWAAATPPQAAGSDGDLGDAGLLPFTRETRAIALWMIGMRVSPESRPAVVQWVNQIQAADQAFRRPLAADIMGDEAIYSRELDLVGLSRHTMGTSLTLSEYRDWLVARRSLARPGSLCWTWIQVSSSPVISRFWDQHHIPSQLEPEQIRLQVFAALAAGMRGLGFWMTRSLNDEEPADRETRLALQQICWELELLEPWLATTYSVSRIPVTVGAGGANKSAGLDSRLRFRRSKRGRFDPEEQEPEPEAPVEQNIPELTSAVLKTDFGGTLLLPMWLDENAQFVPGPMAAGVISMVVPGIEETAMAWEITTTGIHNLERQRVNGGMKVTLKNFDQTACILLTSNPDLVEEVRRRVAAIEERSAQTCLALAELKLDRVRAIDQNLGELGLRQPDGPHYLGHARQMFDDARAAMAQKNWHRVRIRSQQALQMVRALQRAHWDAAVEHLSSPVASPYAVSFQSLPVQARLALATADVHPAESDNLLPSGNFEDVSVPLTAVGWKHEQPADEHVRAQAELNFESHRGRYCLRLKALPGKMPLAVPLGQEFVKLTTPPITVHSGHVLRVAGWIRLPADLPGSQDGVMVYDSLAGRNLALRFRKECGWQRFEFVREVTESQDVTVTLALTGLGEVSFDDLEITSLPLSSVAQAAHQESSIEPRPAPPLTRWSDLRRFNPLTPRRAPSKSVP